MRCDYFLVEPSDVNWHWQKFAHAPLEAPLWEECFLWLVLVILELERMSDAPERDVVASATLKYCAFDQLLIPP
jgi:hypothetical protein